MSQIELHSVSKAFAGVQVIHDVDLKVNTGELVVFVGPSGCGKSTLLRMIAGLEEITAGELEIGGRNMTEAEPSDRGIAMVFQSYALYPHMSVADNMGFNLRMSRRPRAEIAEKVAKAAEILQLTELLDRKPAALSGGQRQRVAIGRAIVRVPQVFLFDEPLSNLDAELRVQTRVEIAKLHAQLGNTMIYVTHDQTEAMTPANRIVVLRAGRVEQVGKPVDLYEDPDNAFVAGFIGSPRMNFLDARVTGPAEVEVAGVTVPLSLASTLTVGDRLSFGIRPEHLGEGGSVALPCEVDLAQRLGATTYIHGALSSGERVVAEQRKGLAEGASQIDLQFDPTFGRLFGADGLRIR
ncbi:ABC transporter ATP-binding protein [Roseisalinus antarcticus]|uniref:Maltose/maltodextrin import ATP-binding protein MalK n=1 Tax=Roseisalinus antarcticus TaxID=254357 RepID=A0A1Y5TCK7_9RHOB|nr:sn-glycerol-3-phosphate ABC transporter ATP-binding protein UgpC [Roseisalinus antarcticus]SLN57355.1 Maltose/maltodextrin import ATP-binding protein MalK [Roseisalinus antarcticus]